MTRLSVFRAALLLLFALSTGPAAAAESDKVTIAASQTGLLVWIAQESGLLNNEGLDIEVKLFQSGFASAGAVVSGEADLSTTSESAFVSHSLKHPDLRVLAVLSTVETARLLARGDRNIEKARDLAGKRIGVTLGSTGEFFLGRYLAINGMSLSSVETVNLKPAEIATSLVSGEIDAGLTWEPYAHQAETGLAGNVLELPDQEGLFYYFMLVSSADWIHDNLDRVKAIMRALVRAEQLVVEQDSHVKKLIQDRFGFDEAYVDHLWPLHNLRVSLPQDLLFLMEEQAEWRIRSGLTDRESVPNYLDLIDGGPIRATKPSAVGIVQ